MWHSSGEKTWRVGSFLDAKLPKLLFSQKLATFRNTHDTHAKRTQNARKTHDTHTHTHTMAAAVSSRVSAPLAGSKRKAASASASAPHRPPPSTPAYRAFVHAVDNAEWQTLARHTLVGERPWLPFINMANKNGEVPLSCIVGMGDMVEDDDAGSTHEEDWTDTTMTAIVLLAAGARTKGAPFVCIDVARTQTRTVYASALDMIKAQCDDATLTLVKKVVRARDGAHRRDAMHIAAAADVTPLVKWLAALDHPLNGHDCDGNTPLHLALQREASPATVRALIKAGARTTSVNVEGYTPLHCIAMWPTNTEDAVERAKAVLAAPDVAEALPVRNVVAAMRPFTPLTLAAVCGNDTAIALLLDAGAVPVEEVDGVHTLHAAIKYCSAGTVLRLLPPEYDAARDGYALDVARKHDKHDIVRALLEARPQLAE